MKKTVFICDACEKSTADIVTVKIPIISTGGSEGTCLRLHDIDLCHECANEISKAYYRIAEQHNNTGVRAVVVGELLDGGKSDDSD